MPDAAPAATASVKEVFSGPADLLELAHKVAAPNKEWGAWSTWVCTAIREKLVRDGHWPNDRSAARAAALALVDELGPERACAVLTEQLKTRLAEPPTKAA